MVEYISPLMPIHIKCQLLQTASEGGSLTCTFRSGDYCRRISSWKVHRPKYTTAGCFTPFQQLYKYFDSAQQFNEIPTVELLCPHIIHWDSGKICRRKVWSENFRIQDTSFRCLLVINVPWKNWVPQRLWCDKIRLFILQNFLSSFQNITDYSAF